MARIEDFATAHVPDDGGGDAVMAIRECGVDPRDPPDTVVRAALDD
ncbi:MAG: hypothetical protein QF634_05735 [Vicinamibacterales bacterium]|nr:hypothetical protein [Vicinamibacterales bacterium]